MKALRLGGIAILLVAALAYAADGIVLKYVYKKDSVSKTRLKGTVNLAGQEVLVNMVNRTKVKDIDADGNVTLEDGIMEGTITIGGQEIPLGAQSANIVVMSPGGEVKKIGDKVETDAYRMQNLMAFVPSTDAVQVGSKWKREIPANKDTKAPGFKTEYTISGEENVGGADTFKIDYKALETEGDMPASVTGTFWISKLDCALIKGTAKWENVPEPTSHQTISGTVTLELIK